MFVVMNLSSPLVACGGYRYALSATHVGHLTRNPSTLVPLGLNPKGRLRAGDLREPTEAAGKYDWALRPKWQREDKHIPMQLPQVEERECGTPLAHFPALNANNKDNV
jgi:hypothetical protein